MVRWFPFPLTGVPKPTPTDIIDVLVVAFLIYQLLLIVRGRRAAHVLVGLCILAGIYAAAVWALGLYVTNQAAASAGAKPQQAAKATNRQLSELAEREARAKALQKALERVAQQQRQLGQQATQLPAPSWQRAGPPC